MVFQNFFHTLGTCQRESKFPFQKEICLVDEKKLNEWVPSGISFALDPQAELCIVASSSPGNTFPCNNKKWHLLNTWYVTVLSVSHALFH